MNLKASIWIDAPRGKVWNRLIDLERAPEHVPFLVRAEPFGGDVPAVGTGAHLTFVYQGQQVTADAVVTDLREGRQLAVRADKRSVGVTVDVTWSVREERDGTVLTMTVQVAYHTLLSQLAAQTLLSGRLGDEELAAGLARFKASVEDEKGTP